MVTAVPGLYFALNSHQPRRVEQRKPDETAPAIEPLFYSFPDPVVGIEGHSILRGVLEYKDRLPMERAGSDRHVLLILTFPEDRLRTVSMAYRRPQCPTHDAACRQKNQCDHIPAPRTDSDNGCPTQFGGMQS
jgi:outer membrane protein OmpA-like peptidoglycan-associated protein